MPTGSAAAAVLCIMENVFHLNENEEMLLAVAQVQRLVGSLVWKTLMVCAAQTVDCDITDCNEAQLLN